MNDIYIEELLVMQCFAYKHALELVSLLCGEGV